MVDESDGSRVKEAEKVLETPHRGGNQIAESVCKFEDSPVFNFLNNLSPINPVESVHISQTINPLNFASLPPVFTSPHVSSLRESRILRRHKPPDPSKPEPASVVVQISEMNADCSNQLDTREENQKAGEADGELSGETSFDCSNFVVDFSGDPIYSGCSPNSDSLTNKGDYTCGSSKKVVSPGSSQMAPCRISDQDITEAPSRDWDSLILDALMFESPSDTESCRKSVQPESSYHQPLLPGEETNHEIHSTRPGEKTATTEVQETTAGSPENDNCKEIENEREYRGMRRRCLVYETGSGHRKYLDQNYGPTQSFSNDSSRHMLPGIGLHLNALATTPKYHDSSASARLLIGPGSSVILDNILPSPDGENQDAIVPMEDDTQKVSSSCMKSEDINQISPKKKRRRAEQNGDGEGCKGCNCKKSKCLKLYCECFAAGIYCVDLCACIDCFNKPVHEETVLATRKQIESRNPLAFAPKVIRGSDQPSETMDDSSTTPASARHKRGCNCKKSGCFKKYCECYQGGVGCSINCRCEGCKNAFGRKDGSSSLIRGLEELEVYLDGNETDGSEKSLAGKEEQNPATPQPRRGPRQPVELLPLSSMKKPPKSKRSARHPRKRDHHLRPHEEEMPGCLQESGIKSISPKGKRVSPPHNNGGGLRSSRKLILQSIPSFPSLTHNQ